MGFAQGYDPSAMTNRSSLGSYLTTAGEVVGLSVEDASQALEVSENQIRIWEACPDQVPLKTLAELVHIYEGDPNEFHQYLSPYF